MGDMVASRAGIGPRPVRVAALVVAFAVAAAGCSDATHPTRSPEQSGAVAAAFVLSAARHTLKQRTVDITMGGTISAAGHSIAIHGSGQGDLTTNNIRLSARMNVGGKTLTLRELFWHGQLYMSVDTPGQTMRQATGYEWVKLPITASSAPSLTSGNPLQALATLERRGASVRDLGGSRIDGQPVHGYAVTPSHAAVVAAARKSLASLHLPSAQRAAILRTAQNSPAPTINVWFDTTRKLLRRTSIDMTLNGLGTNASGTVTMGFTHYGVPVTITAPAARDVMSYQQFARHHGR